MVGPGGTDPYGGVPVVAGEQVGKPTVSGLSDSIGHLVEKCPQLCGFLRTQLLGDPRFNLHDHGFGIPQGIAACVGEAQLLHVAVARVRSVPGCGRRGARR